MSSDGISDTPTNLALPRTDATLTVRVIKSFEFRTEKSLVLHHVNCETTTVGQLKDLVKQGIYSFIFFESLFPSIVHLDKCTYNKLGSYHTQLYRHRAVGSRIVMLNWVRLSLLVHDSSFQYQSSSDTLKLYTKAHGAKVREALSL